MEVMKIVSYLNMLVLEKNARKILTDSGGVQKEAYIFKVPCITLRENTEWVETVEDGWNVLVGANDGAIMKMANGFEPKRKQRDAFGDGKAGERVAKMIGEEKEKIKREHVDVGRWIGVNDDEANED